MHLAALAVTLALSFGPEESVAPTPPIIVCEGRLLEPHFGWTVQDGYAQAVPVERSVTKNQKTAALQRALSLMSGAQRGGFDAGSLVFQPGKAPALRATPHLASIYPKGLPVLSLAHSGSLLLAAAGVVRAGPGATGLVLGVDVERLRSRDFKRIEGHMGWRDTAALWPENSQQRAEKLLFYRRWTLAESLYKALGKVNLEYFRELERLAVDGLWSEAGPYLSQQQALGWDSGWLNAIVGQRRWFVRWWQVRGDDEPAMVCLLRGVAI